VVGGGAAVEDGRVVGLVALGRLDHGVSLRCA
jgi:hypothetical protein